MGTTELCKAIENLTLEIRTAAILKEAGRLAGRDDAGVAP